jgi:hypothetical protein
MAEGSAAAVTGPGVVLTPSLPALPTMPRTRLLWGGLVFGALIAGVFWRLFASVAGAAAGPALGDLRWGYLALLLLLLGVSLWTCLQSELATAAIPRSRSWPTWCRRASRRTIICSGDSRRRTWPPWRGSSAWGVSWPGTDRSRRRPPEPSELRGGPGS